MFYLSLLGMDLVETHNTCRIKQRSEAYGDSWRNVDWKRTKKPFLGFIYAYIWKYFLNDIIIESANYTIPK